MVHGLTGTRILSTYGIPVVPEVLTTSLEEGLAAADRLGYPVAAKLESPGLAHKAAAGGVVLNIRDPSGLEEAFNRLRHLVDNVTGVLIQKMVTDGVAEVIVGMSRDPQFGPVIACGLGGVFVETLKEVQLLLPPVTSRYAERALGRLRGAALLDPAHRDALVDVLIRFSELCVDLQDVFRAIDINPLILRSSGDSIVAVDSLFET
jgi:succinyl-CoA synthetase beta subunit